MAELARPDGLLAQDAGRPLVGPDGRPRGVVARGRGRLLRDAVGELDPDGDPRARVGRGDAALAALDRDIERGQPGGDPVQVIGVIDADAEPDQTAQVGVDDGQLLAAVDGRERAPPA